VNYKLAVFVIAAMLAAIGGIYMYRRQVLSHPEDGCKASIEMVMWVALGGRGRLKGAIIGALL